MNQVKSLLSMSWDTVLNPGLIALHLVQQAWSHGHWFINKWMHSQSENQFDDRKQDGIVPKFGLQWLQNLETIQAEPSFLCLTQEDKRRSCLQSAPPILLLAPCERYNAVYYDENFTGEVKEVTKGRWIECLILLLQLQFQLLPNQTWTG